MEGESGIFSHLGGKSGSHPYLHMYLGTLIQTSKITLQTEITLAILRVKQYWAAELHGSYENDSIWESIRLTRSGCFFRPEYLGIYWRT